MPGRMVGFRPDTEWLNSLSYCTALHYDLPMLFLSLLSVISKSAFRRFMLLGDIFLLHFEVFSNDYQLIFSAQLVIVNLEKVFS